ncbi:MAG: LuxR C-terminal-related transcriptional regulator [Dehalococcoidia bacterium]
MELAKTGGENKDSVETRLQFLVDLHTPVSRHAISHEIPEVWPSARVREVVDWQEIEASTKGCGRETIVLMSLRVHGLAGWDQLARWRLDHREVRLVLVLQSISQQLTTNALSIRPAAILADDFSMADLMDTLALVARGYYIFHADSNPPPIAVAWIYQKEIPIGASMPSDVELKVLELLSSGYTEKEVATAINVEPRTVETYLKRIRSKIGAKNSRHAVSLAVSWGLVTPSEKPGIR